MNSRLARPLLTIAVGGALVAGGGLAATPALAAPADTTAPVGTYKLNSAALWIGQSVSLTQGTVTDDTSAPEQVIRLVDWGDSSALTKMEPGTAKYAHKYTRNGKFKVKVTYQDAAGNASAVESFVTVTTPGRVKLSKTSLWNGERLYVTFAGVPAGTKSISFDWGDSFVDKLPGKNQSIRGLYYKNRNGRLIRGAVTLRATYTNGLGASSPIVVGKVTVKRDATKPVVKINKPGSANRLASWKTIKGTVADKGAVSPYVYVWVTRITGSKSYCYTTKKTWKRYYGTAGYNKYCGRSSVQVTVTKGKWSMKLPGLKKGMLYVDARARDWSDNASKWASVSAKLTRS